MKVQFIPMWKTVSIINSVYWTLIIIKYGRKLLPHVNWLTSYHSKYLSSKKTLPIAVEKLNSRRKLFIVQCTYINEFWIHRQWSYPNGIHIWGHWIIHAQYQNLMSKKSIDPDVFSTMLGTDRSLAQGHQVGAIEHIKLFPAPWGKCSSLLTDGTLNNCFITVYLILFHTLFQFLAIFNHAVIF